MVIKGIVQDGLIRIDVRGVLPEGSSVLVIPVETNQPVLESAYDLKAAKVKFSEIIALPSMGPSDSFSGADHDKLLYGEAQ